MPRIDQVQRRGRTIHVDFADGGVLHCDRDFLPGRRLAVGQAIETPILDRLREQAALHEAERWLLRWLAGRPRSRADLARRLRERGTPAPLAAQALDRIAAQGHLNDRAFAASWTESRVRSRPRARRLIVQELRAQGVDAAVAADVTRHVDDEALAAKLAAAQAKRCPNWDAYRARAGGLLTRRGFSRALTERALQAGWGDPALRPHTDS